MSACLAMLLWAMLPGVASAQTGRKFVSLEAAIVALVNLAYNDCRMSTNELEVIEGREAILKGARASAKVCAEVVPDIPLRVPNEFGSLVGSPNAYCMIALPVCPTTTKTLTNVSDAERLDNQLTKEPHGLEAPLGFQCGVHGEVTVSGCETKPTPPKAP